MDVVLCLTKSVNKALLQKGCFWRRLAAVMPAVVKPLRRRAGAGKQAGMTILADRLRKALK
jgi:hypothetical protein